MQKIIRFSQIMHIGEECMKNKMLTSLILVALLLMSFACSNDDSNDTNTSQIDFEDLQIQEDFNYSTTELVNIDLQVFNGQGQGVANIPFKIYDKDPSLGGKLLEAASTNEAGRASFKSTLPTYLTSIYVMGYMSSLELPITNNSVSYQFGTGLNDKGRNDKKPLSPPKTDLEYLSEYNAVGVPLNMERDDIPAAFLTKVDATLPESRPVPQYHPTYLADGNQLNVLVIDEAAEVWVTFVHEGAGHLNSLGYYTYQAGNPPQSRDDIDLVKIIFPNVSMVNSGGGLVPGDKISLGIFQPGTIIGWVLMDNGWYSGGAHLVTNSWFSNTNLNPDNNQQSILVYDNEYQKLLFAFEDLVFNIGDDDYNDAVFYATANPIESIDIDDVQPIDTPDDEDGDGISDIFDDFPSDPNKAFHTNNYSNSTLVFEDLWPQKGDYDFNDMVIDYNMFFHKNVQGQVTNLITEFELRAVGARKQNGFAVEFPFNSTLIQDYIIIDGTDSLSYSNVISHASFNPVLEDGQRAVIRFINNTNDFIAQNNDDFINTQAGTNYIQPVKVALNIIFTSPQDTDNWQWSIPFNPFIFVDRVREHEVHLSDYPPSNLADLTLFGLNDDNSNINQNRFYKTVNNHPWALNIAESWDYPYETKKINHAYHKFQAWAESSGQSYPDWYLDLPEYRDNQLIYQQP
jgi:LruC domain-containing protein